MESAESFKTSPVKKNAPHHPGLTGLGGGEECEVGGPERGHVPRFEPARDGPLQEQSRRARRGRGKLERLRRRRERRE